MNSLEYFTKRFEEMQFHNGDALLAEIRRKAFDDFKRLGIPTVRNEEWKYTRISGAFNKNYIFAESTATPLESIDINALRLPGSSEAWELFFINGVLDLKLSNITADQFLTVVPFEEVSKSGFGKLVAEHFGNSARYLNDGINALSTAFISGAAFIHIRKNNGTLKPLYIYNITDSRSGNIYAQPRSLIYMEENSTLQVVESFLHIGDSDSFTNHVAEFVVNKNASLEYYKIQNESSTANSVSTTHIHQTGSSLTHAVTVSLDGGIVRNNMNIVLDAEHSEAHLYGLYFQSGHTHIDNHTIVDNRKPNCLSKELYKGILDGESTGVFNGKIFVQPLAQKTNAYQSNKNILLSDSASVNSKPQLEIFADDVKCSHGCTVGRLDDEGLFYLQSRGISEKTARALLLHAFTEDVLDNIKLPLIRQYANKLIAQRLEFDATW